MRVGSGPIWLLSEPDSRCHRLSRRRPWRSRLSTGGCSKPCCILVGRLRSTKLQQIRSVPFMRSTQTTAPDHIGLIRSTPLPGWLGREAAPSPMQVRLLAVGGCPSGGTAHREPAITHQRQTSSRLLCDLSLSLRRSEVNGGPRPCGSRDGKGRIMRESGVGMK